MSQLKNIQEEINDDKIINKNEKIINILKERDNNNRIIELYFWLFVSLFYAAGIIFPSMRYQDFSEILSNRFIEITPAFLILIFPVFFRLIFSNFPLEHLRKYSSAKSYSKNKDNEEAEIIKSADSGVLVEKIISNEVNKLNYLDLMSKYAINSDNLSKQIYSRAGVYLIVGVFVAFIGLYFFYLETSSNLKINSYNEFIFNLLPKFGILFFIEFVALFFLRQYRSAMDEFRYYEAIKRNREEIFVALKILKENNLENDLIQMMKTNFIFSKAGVLDNGQSSELIESRKLEKNEFEILEKILDTIAKSKR